MHDSLELFFKIIFLKGMDFHLLLFFGLFLQNIILCQLFLTLLCYIRNFIKSNHLDRFIGFFSRLVRMYPSHAGA